MKKSLFSVLLLALISTSAFAKSDADIVTGGTNAALTFAQDSQDDYTARFTANLGYDHVFTKGFAFGGDVDLSYGSNIKTYVLKVGPSYNFQANDIENSYNVSLKAGIQIVSISGQPDYDNAVATLEGGKRFKLVEGITYSPSLAITQVFGHNEPDPSFTLNIFRFALVF